MTQTKKSAGSASAPSRPSATSLPRRSPRPARYEFRKARRLAERRGTAR